MGRARFVVVGSGVIAMLIWACDSFTGAASTGDPDGAAMDGTSSPQADGSGATDANADAFAPCDPDASTPPSDTHNCGACGRECFGGACNLGTCAPTILRGGLNHPQGLSLSGSQAYVTENAIGGNLFAIPKSGGVAPVLFTGDHLTGVAATSDGVYFAAHDANELRLAGTLTPASFATPQLVFADDASVMVTSGASSTYGIVRPTLDGSVITEFPGGQTIAGATLDAKNFFVTVHGFSAGSTTPLSSLDRSNNNVFNSADYFVSPSAIVSLGADLFFVETGNLRVLMLPKASFQTLNAFSPVATDLTAPTLLATDGSALFLVDGDALFRIDVVTHLKTALLSGVPGITALAVDADSIYFTVQGSADGGAEDAGYLARLAK